MKTPIKLPLKTALKHFTSERNLEMAFILRSGRWFVLVIIFICMSVVVSAQSTDEATDEAQNGDTLLYLDASAPLEVRVEDLLGRMTLEEKVGQMTQIEKNSLESGDVTDYFLGSVLSGGGGYPHPNTAEAWAEMVDGFQEEALATRLAIPLIYGVDAVHGHNNIYGAVIFPHNIGLGATGNADLVEQIGRATAENTLATGIYWNFAPVLAVVQDYRWGRTYEAYSDNPELVTRLGTAFLLGLQGEQLGSEDSVLATPKHFIGDGGAVFGTSTTGNYLIDQGQTLDDETMLREVYLPPYIDAIQNGAMSIMVSFSSWGDLKMHAHEDLLTGVLKEELGFEGYIISDWGGIDQISTDYYDAVVTALNAGVDMNMVPYDAPRFINTLLDAVEAGDVAAERIDDAVRRILRVKFMMGLFENPFSNPDLLSTVGSDEQRELARQAVQESLVLLQNNERTLPIARNTPLIFVAGTGADDLGMQSGGWTIEWQGLLGNITVGTTILDGIEAVVDDPEQVVYDRFGKFRNRTDEAGNDLIADVGIVVVGEVPYAEGVGDRADLQLSQGDKDLIERVRSRVDRLVVVLLSGRPMTITDQLAQSDAFVAAWLPGTEGQGVADVLFGDVDFTGKLSFRWQRTDNQLPILYGAEDEGCDAPLFPFGYGLTLESSADDQIDSPAECE
jgi:beta-glucosidase